MTIPGTKVTFDERTIRAVLDDTASVLRSGQLSNGRCVERFERTFGQCVTPGAGATVAVNSGTGALEVTLRSLGVTGGRVICPTNTYAATAWAIIAAGNVPVFVGCDAELQASVDDIRSALDRNSGPPITAVVVTHVGGVISRRMPEIVTLCREHGIPLIEDAAHAHGARLGGMTAGCIGDGAAFSLFATKVITSGEGGVAVFRREEDAAMARILRDQGKQPGTGNLHVLRGYNWRMSEMHAIVGHHHAVSFSERHRSRAAAATSNDAALAQVPRVTPLAAGRDRVFSHYKYIVFADDDLAGVPQGGRVYEALLHTQPVFAGVSIDAVSEVHPNVQRHRCLPLYDHMSTEDVDTVIAALRARAPVAV